MVDFTVNEKIPVDKTFNTLNFSPDCFTQFSCYSHDRSDEGMSGSTDFFIVAMMGTCVTSSVSIHAASVFLVLYVEQPYDSVCKLHC